MSIPNHKQMDKTSEEYAEQLAEKSIYVTKAFVRGYMAAIEETNVKQLAEENERLREALLLCKDELYSIHSQYGDRQNALDYSYALQLTEKAIAK